MWLKDSFNKCKTADKYHAEINNTFFFKFKMAEALENKHFLQLKISPKNKHTNSKSKSNTPCAAYNGRESLWEENPPIQIEQKSVKNVFTELSPLSNVAYFGVSAQ